MSIATVMRRGHPFGAFGASVLDHHPPRFPAGVYSWGWYYVRGLLGDYSRYLIACQVLRDMTGQTVKWLRLQYTRRALAPTACLSP